MLTAEKGNKRVTGAPQFNTNTRQQHAAVQQTAEANLRAQQR
eukprot:CAMPEP_0117683474 /NCGR_PEP_ID=MMETSP0804-20121206/20419_1 /TAXON_ID=1074897 /ORGANISM="Tetraselmis astigmatica, Strain CCMP880" /LENGTH=41 /DNA_ID= /DNA_START= /DNA_END= /DNA_ORIENTATION=